MIDPQLDHDQGVAVNFKWGGDQGWGVSDMDEEEGFGYTLNGADTQIGIVCGKDGPNAGGNATVSVTVDLRTLQFDRNQPRLVSGSGTATNVAFDNDVDIDTFRVLLDEVNDGNFDDLEIDDITVERVD